MKWDLESRLIRKLRLRKSRFDGDVDPAGRVFGNVEFTFTLAQGFEVLSEADRDELHTDLRTGFLIQIRKGDEEAVFVGCEGNVDVEPA